MLASLVLVGFMAYERSEFSFDAEGVTTIYGASESGKSCLIEGVMFALFGQDADGEDFPIDGVRDGFDRVEAELVTSWGKTLRRTMTRKRSHGRTVVDDGETSAIPTEDGWRQGLGIVGANPELARLVMSPFQWVPLLTTQLGRPLRDVVLSLLPKVDARAVVGELLEAGKHTMKASDPIDEGAAKKLLTATNSNRDEMKGRLDSARDRLLTASTPVGAPAPAALEEARTTAKADEAWRAHDRLVATHATAASNVTRQTRARDEWRARRDGAGERPTFGAAALQAATVRVQNAEAAHASAKTEHEVAGRAWTSAKHALNELLTATKCSACDRPFDGAPDPANAQDAVNVAKKQGDEARTALDAAAAEVAEARRELTPLSSAQSRAAAWDASQRTLGNEPSVDVAPIAPTPPEMQRPTQAKVSEMTAVFDAATRAKGAAERAATEKDAAKAGLAKAEAEHTSAEAEAIRVAALVDAVRRAPTEIISRQSASLPAMGCVSWRFPPKENSKTPEMEVLIDGRSWKRASAGKRILADLQMRAAIRTLAGLDPLPIFVDNTQDWSGEWPTIEGPVVYLVTRAGEMSVENAMPQRMAA